VSESLVCQTSGDFTIWETENHCVNFYLGGVAYSDIPSGFYLANSILAGECAQIYFWSVHRDLKLKVDTSETAY
jgi:hypothetical protein